MEKLKICVIVSIFALGTDNAVAERYEFQVTSGPSGHIISAFFEVNTELLSEEISRVDVHDNTIVQNIGAEYSGSHNGEYFHYEWNISDLRPWPAYIWVNNSGYFHMDFNWYPELAFGGCNITIGLQDSLLRPSRDDCGGPDWGFGYDFAGYWSLPLNQPPVAVCQDVVVAVGEVPNIDGGSYDPDGDSITIEQSPAGSFPEAGIYYVVLTVTDELGGTDTCTAMVVVYDPSAGFVTGGGWIWSPAGAYRDAPTLEGKANFGFVSKYQKGANVPTGNTEFQFQAGSLNFHSSNYDWLVVNQNGSNAQFKGSGTINGAGVYKFMLWAGDGVPDTLRIKIWSENPDGTGVVVYDNGVNQPIGGGSIVIHTK